MPFYVTLAHPNPAGKDKPAHQAPSNDKLNQEWVEFKNINSGPVSLEGASLYHLAFDHYGRAHEEKLISFSGTLHSGHSMRVHTGRGTTYVEGSTHHIYADRGNFVWNNQNGDDVIIRVNGTLNDHAAYDPNPPEGAVLYRISGTNKLGIAAGIGR